MRVHSNARSICARLPRIDRDPEAEDEVAPRRYAMKCTDVNEKLTHFLEAQRNEIVSAWKSRLGCAASLAASLMEPASMSPVEVMYREMLRLVRVPPLSSTSAEPSLSVADLKPLPD